MQQLSGGLDAMFADLIVNQLPDGRIEHYDVLVYVVVLAMGIVMVFGAGLEELPRLCPGLPRRSVARLVICAGGRRWADADPRRPQLWAEAYGAESVTLYLAAPGKAEATVLVTLDEGHMSGLVNDERYLLQQLRPRGQRSINRLACRKRLLAALASRRHSATRNAPTAAPEVSRDSGLKVLAHPATIRLRAVPDRVAQRNAIAFVPQLPPLLRGRPAGRLPNAPRIAIVSATKSGAEDTGAATEGSRRGSRAG